MRNFANYQVDIRHRTSGVIKTILIPLLQEGGELR